MKKDLTFLGIETSCDETAASVVREDEKGNVKILSNVVSSQVDEHLKFGGVVPETAARSHAEKIDIIIKKAIDDSKCKFEELDGVAATARLHLWSAANCCHRPESGAAARTAGDRRRWLPDLRLF